jgi:hypothetical protein
MNTSKRPVKARKLPALSLEQGRRHRQLVEWTTKDREQRRASPVWTILIDLAVGIPMTASAVVIFLSYLGIIRG